MFICMGSSAMVHNTRIQMYHRVTKWPYEVHSDYNRAVKIMYIHTYLKEEQEHLFEPSFFSRYNALDAVVFV
jgi:hypothetical protein